MEIAVKSEKITTRFDNDNNDYYVDLEKAVVLGDLMRVQVLLAYGMNVNFKTVDSGDTLLHLSYSAEITKALLWHGANVHLKNQKRMNALETAVYESKDFELISALVKAGANVYATVPYEGNTLLHMCRSAEVAILLLSYGLDVHEKNRKGETPLGKAIHEEKELELIQTFIEYGSTFPIVEVLVPTPALKNRVEIIKLLLCAGADIDATSSNHETALHVAVKGGKNLKMVRMLLRRGANVNARDIVNNTPLSLAIQDLDNDPEIVEELLQNDADVHVELNEPQCAGETLPCDANFNIPCAKAFIKHCVINCETDLAIYKHLKTSDELSRYMDDCISESKSMEVCISESKSMEVCISESKSMEVCISESKSMEVCISESKSMEVCISESKSMEVIILE